MLRLSLEPLSLEEMLGRALDLLLSLSWIRSGVQGGHFPRRGRPAGARHEGPAWAHGAFADGMPSSAHGLLPMREGGEHRQVVFAGCVDEHHVTRYSGMTPHGHYCVPIISDDALLGVINLYVKHGHERNPAEEGFLTAVADVLAGIVKRKRGGRGTEQERRAIRPRCPGNRRRYLGLGSTDQRCLLLAPLEEHVGIRGPRDQEPLQRMGDTTPS